MNNVESIEEFYKRKYDWLPENIKSDIGHFNLFPLEPIDPSKAKPLPYKRRDFYKVMLVIGNINFLYADKIIPTNKYALVFSNPQIPYSCEHLDRIEGGFYCIFNQHFFHQFGNLNQYSVFQPMGNHIFDLSQKQAEDISTIYKKMYEEFNSDYVHKYDVLRNLVFELLHFAMKMQPTAMFDKQPLNASQRIATLFLELLERQFPIDENHPSVNIRSASEFANQLNVHVNHLNRAVKETTQKTTTQIIAERILQEAKILLKYSHWQIAEIAYALGFTEVPHFNNFFKKHTQINPSKFRSV